MSKKIITPINKRHILDVINESMLIREFSIYGCEESPGKVFGYNPFSNKCIDITGYEGPERPAPVVTTGGKKVSDDSSGRSISDAFSSFSGAAEFLGGVYLGAFDAEEVVGCFTENTAFSVMGLFYGKTAVKILPKLAYAGAKAAYRGLTPSGKMSSELATYASRRAPRDVSGFSEFYSSAARKAKYLSQFSRSAAKVSVLLGIGAAYGLSYAYSKTPDDWIGNEAAGDIVNWFDQRVYGSKSWDSWRCFGTAAVLAVSMGLVLRKGPGMLLNITKSASKASVGIASMLKSPTFRTFITDSFEKAIKNAKSEQLSLFKFLKDSGKLPDGAKIVLDKSSGQGVLKLTGVSGPITISATAVPKELLKYAKDGKIVLDPKIINAELQEVSKQVSKIVTDGMEAEAAKFSKSDVFARLKALRAAAKKYGTASPAAVRSDAFKNSSEILENLGKQIEDNIKQVDELGSALINQERVVMDIFQSLKGVRSVNFDSIKKLAANKKSEQEVIELIDRTFPDLSAEAPKAYKKISDYFKASREYNVIQKDLVTDIELSRKALIDETGIIDLFKDGSNNKANHLEDWLNTPAGKQHADTWGGKPFRKAAAIAGKKHILPELKTIILNLASPVGIASIGLGKLATELYDMFGDSGVDIDFKSIDLNNIADSSMKSFKKLKFENFIDENFQVNTEKLLISALSNQALSAAGADETTIKLLTKRVSQVVQDEKMLSIADKHFNRGSADVMVSEQDIQSRFREFVEAIIKDASNKKEEINEVKEMSKKDIRQLVAEVLNEGYGKYPYHSNEPSEGEPDEDYMVEWKALVDEVCDNKKKNIDGDPNTFDDATIEVAKILVKDQDLFRDVLEMAGSNKSIGVEIMQQLKAAREKKNLDKELDV